MTTALESYRAAVGGNVLDELYALAAPLKGRRVQHINATRQGGGVAEILDRMVPLLSELGLPGSWDVLEGNEEFFRVTKSFHNAIQGQAIDLGTREYEIYLDWTRRNSQNIELYGDFVFVHDPQPCAMIARRTRGTSASQRCVWRCHIDASRPHRGLWSFLERYMTQYDASIFSASAFAGQLPIPQYLITPSIDPLADKNRPLEHSQIDAILERHHIDATRPILTQISRFDHWKDPVGVIRTYRLVRETHDCQLVLAGGSAHDDPEGAQVLAEVREAAGDDPDIHVLELPGNANLEVNALQRASTIILQKSTREGFGLTVTEGLWKGRPVIGGATGGIPLQILDGVTGYLVHSSEGAAFRARYLLNHPEVAAAMGRRGVEHVRQNFLTTRNLRDYLLVMHATRNGERVIHL